MISPNHVRLMARYNAWQNTSLYTAADTLPDETRRQQRGAFFGSIHATLSHLLWGDRIWLSRFAGEPRPPGSIGESPELFPDWSDLKAQRLVTDGRIQSWASGVETGWLEADLKWYSGINKRESVRPAWILVAHFFNHQTHHRGQVHAMLTAAGAVPEATDLMLMKPE